MTMQFSAEVRYYQRDIPRELQQSFFFISLKQCFTIPAHWHNLLCLAEQQKQTITKVRQCMYKRNIYTRSRNHFCSGKAICVTIFECLSVVSVTHQGNRMLRIISASVACPAVPKFFPLFHKRNVFRKKKVWLNIKCVLIFSRLPSEIFLTLRRIQLDIIINVHVHSCKLLVIILIF